MASTMGLLAMNQEEQEELYKHLRSVVPDGRLPVCRDNLITSCSHSLRAIKMFRNSHGFLPSSTKHSVYSPQ